MAGRPAIVRLAIIQVGLVIAVGTGLWLSYPAWKLGQTSDRLRKEFPELTLMATTDLAAWLRARDGGYPVILDVRTPEEFAVSHLASSHRVDGEGELRADDLPDEKGRAIVLACSTGERAALFGRRLREAGYSRIFVLEGGLVKWANEGRPLTDGQKLVTRVHGDTEVSRLLKRAHRAMKPAEH